MNSTKKYNCSMTCVGFYADVVKMKSSAEMEGEEVVKEKYQMLVAEYRKFKAKNVKHFKFNQRANASAFGEFKHPWFDCQNHLLF